jgi:hypothetical protein
MGFALHVFQVQMLSLARDAAWGLLEGFTEVGYNQDPQGKHGNTKHRQTEMKTQFCRPATIINSSSFQ